MAHLPPTVENGRQVDPGLGQPQDPQRWSRGRLHDETVADLPKRLSDSITRPLSGSAPSNLVAGYAVLRYGRLDALRNGYFRLAGFGAERSAGPVPADGRGGPILGVRFLIVDDCKLNRENLAVVFAAHGGSELAMAWDLPSLSAALSENAPEVVFFNMGTRNNLTLLRMVRDTCPEARVIVVGIAEDDESEIIACAEAGVAGYHLRADSLYDLLTLLSKVGNGESLCSPKVSAILLKRLSTLATQRRPVPKELVLTAREIQILRLLESGLSNQQIADQLYIALHTVKNHVHSVLNKLGVSTRAAAAAYSRHFLDPEAVEQI
jgi:DNA-binding NarL/FixJ family response regulator